MLVVMHNVGFGDCFWLCNSEELLWVDCGSSAYPCHTFSMSDFSADLLNYSRRLFTKRTAIITHFHHGHISGFKHLAKNAGNSDSFERVFIPYLYFVNSSGKPLFLEMAVYAYTFFSKKSLSLKTASSILKHPSWLAEICNLSAVQCVSTGFTFNQAGNLFSVLWPDRCYSFDKFVEKVVQVLNSATEDLADFHEIKNAITDRFNRWFISISESEKDGAYLYELSEELSGLVRQLDELTVEWPNNVPLGKKDFGQLFTICNNSTSIVFHDSNRKILMNGDITTDIIDKFLSSRYEKHYKAIKVQHHGTKSHYSSLLPSASNLLISTGIHKNYGKIAVDYKYHPYRWGNRWCSSGGQHCQIRDRGYVCANGSCFSCMPIVLRI